MRPTSKKQLCVWGLAKGLEEDLRKELEMHGPLSCEPECCMNAYLVSFETAEDCKKAVEDESSQIISTAEIHHL